MSEAPKNKMPEPAPVFIINLLNQEAPSMLMPFLIYRHHVGITKYGTPLKAFGGTDPIVYAFEEFLDGIFYLRQGLAERNTFANWLFYRLLLLLTSLYYHWYKTKLKIWYEFKRAKLLE